MTTTLHGQLGLMQEEAFHRYLYNINSGPVSEEHRQAVLDVGMLAMARYELENPTDYVNRFMGGPLWLPGVRSELMSFIGRDPEARGALNGSIYFQADMPTEVQIGRVVSASITPAGIYRGDELAAGVVGGKVFAQPFRKKVSGNG